MTKDKSKRTGLDWHTISATHYKNMPRPVLPIRSQFDARIKVAKHSHPWGQLVYLAGGTLEVETHEGVFVVPANQGLWLPPNVEHEVLCYHGAIDRSLHIAPQLCHSLPRNVFTLNVEGVLKALVLEICLWPKTYELTAKKQRLIEVLLDQLGDAKDSKLFIKTINDKRLLPIVQALMNEPSNNLTLEQWASQVGASSRTLNRLFNLHAGCGFSQWKQKIRIIRSLEMLDAGQRSSAIAYQLGYESSSAFINAFSRHMGCSPQRYMRKV